MVDAPHFRGVETFSTQPGILEATTAQRQVVILFKFDNGLFDQNPPIWIFEPELRSSRRK